MTAHLKNGEFQSDKYPTCPPGKVPLSVKDPTAQDLLWEYAQRRRSVDAEFSDDLEAALMAAGFVPRHGRLALLYVPQCTCGAIAVGGGCLPAHTPECALSQVMVMNVTPLPP